MKVTKKFIQQICALIIGLLGLVFIAPFITIADQSEKAQLNPQDASQFLLIQPTLSISGTYAGTVAITQPVQLSVLDLAFDLTDNGGTFSGQINSNRSLVYSAAPALSGSLTGSTNGITPTFIIASEVFGGFVSGRQIQRQITLEGEVLEGGNLLQGIYEEVISGFTPTPLTARGIFLVVRPAQAASVLAQPSLSVSVDPVAVPPNGSAAVTAAYRDKNLQPISGAEVTFSSALGAVSPSTAQTDNDGLATTTFTAGEIEGVGTITATSNGLTGTVQIIVSGKQLTLQAEGDQLSSGEQVILTATLSDQNNSPLGGEIVNFSASLGSVSPISGTTNSNGQTTTTFTAGNTPGKATVKAQAGLAFASKTFEIAGSGGGTETVYLPLVIKDAD